MKLEIFILVATHNRANYLEETLDSIRAQTYFNWQCIIVDDHSIDNTAEVVKCYLEKDSRFSYFRKTSDYKKGLSGTRNMGLDIAKDRKAKFIQFFDDDDLMHPQKLEMQIKHFSTDETLDLTICCYRKFHEIEAIEWDLEKADDGSCNINSSNLLKDFYLNKINLNSPGPLWKAEILENYRFNEDLFYGEEREYYLRIFINELPKHHSVNKILFWYRKHPEAITSSFYQDTSIKTQALDRVNDLIFEELLRQPFIPVYLLKNYIHRGIKNKETKYISKLDKYFSSKSIFQKFKFQFLHILYNMKING